ncbi:hypothetical protein [Metabacillus fastidiosus]|uniref:hypothetical protein n=1 Tax=Metabacillus fastidiosus TaxID=1458 RepID=UPI003D2E8E6F
MKKGDYRFNTQWYDIECYYNDEYEWIPCATSFQSEDEVEKAMEELKKNKKGFKFHNNVIGYTMLTNEIELIELMKKGNGITYYGFKSKEEAETFTQHFPKYIKVYPVRCSSSSHFGINGISCIPVYVSKTGMSFEAHGISISVSPLNNVTGEMNETGEKRIKAFAKTLKKLGVIQ